MGNIIQLPEDVVNKIAAGEVVERPASVVKELIENAFDAKSTRVEVVVKDGGKGMIMVKDNGTGILKEDLKRAVLPHTTSKVKQLADIFDLKSYGFRGEALASISGVSRLTIHSRYKDAPIGYEYRVYEGKLTPKQRAVGTTVLVEDLFYNVPARRKFLKSATTEYKHVEDTFLGLALANPGVHMVMRSDKRKQTDYDLKQADTRMQRSLDIIGLSVDQVFKLDLELFAIRVSGIIVKPQYVRGKKHYLKTLVNNRIIEDRGIYRVLRDTLRPVFALDISPVGVVYIDLPNSWVDFNVHPRKIEVRFSNPYRVFDAVRKALHSAILGDKGLGGSSISLPKPSYQADALEYTNSIFTPKTSGEHDADGELRVGVSGAKISGDTDARSHSTWMVTPKLERPESASADKPFASQSPIKVFQLMNRYIVAEYTDLVLLIDQHAAAERIRFEELGGEGQSTELSQNLLVPTTFEIAEASIFLDGFLDDLSLLGFDIRLHGDKLMLKAVPSYLGEYKAQELLQVIIDRILEIPEDELTSVRLEALIPAEFKELKRLLVATKACHTSIRANTPLTHQEMLDMVRRLFSCKVPYVCPHGRPVFAEFSQSDLDRFFWRDIK